MAKRAYFIGICGAGMSAAAMILKDLGWEVIGSDENFYPPVSTYLENSGITFFKGYRKENIPADVDMFVIGKHAKLVPEENEEVLAALKTKLPARSFAEVLGDLTQKKESIVIAGSHGKSTCAALLAWCLEYIGRKPGYFIGAVPRTPAASSAAGRDNIFILEGDEYPASSWDSTSKFLHYHPAHLLLTSLAHDHLNVFKTPADYRAPFKQLINSLPADGLLVACADGVGVQETLAELGRKAILYSSQDNGFGSPDRGSPDRFGRGERAGQPGICLAGWRIGNARYRETSSFDIIRNDRKIIRITTRLLGRHNLENILGAAALALTLDFIRPEQFAEAVQEFQPLERRLNKLSEKTRIPIFEGFGSSLDKAKAAISAVKLHWPRHKLVVLFEPHTFSWRSRQALPWYAKVFADADNVFIYKPPTSAAPEDELCLAEMVETVRKNNTNATGFESIEAGLQSLKHSLDEKSAVLILSSGSFDGIIETSINLLEQKFPKQ